MHQRHGVFRPWRDFSLLCAVGLVPRWHHYHTRCTTCSFLLPTVSRRLLLGVLYEVVLDCLIWRPLPSVRLSPSISGFIWKSSWVFFTTSCQASWQSAQTRQNFCYGPTENYSLSRNIKPYEIQKLKNSSVQSVHCVVKHTIVFVSCVIRI